MVLVTTPPQHQRVQRLLGVGELDDQAGLPDAGISVDDEEPASPLAHRCRPLAEQGRLGFATDEQWLVRRARHPGAVAGRRGCRRAGRFRCAFRRDRKVERRLLSEDRMFHPGDVVSRLDAQFGDQHGAQILEDAQCLGLPTRAVEREHALRPQALAHRVGAGQRLQLAGQCLVATHRQRGVDPQLRGGEQQLLEAARLGPGEGLVAHLAVGRSPPQVLRFVDEARGLGGTAPGQLSAGLRHELLEAEDVGRLGRDIQQVARSPGHDQVTGRAGITQPLAQARNGRTKRDVGPLPIVVSPERVHEPIHRDDEVAVDEEPGHQGPRLLAPEIDGTAVPGDLDGTKDADLEPGRARINARHGPAQLRDAGRRATGPRQRT